MYCAQCKKLIPSGFQGFALVHPGGAREQFCRVRCTYNWLRDRVEWLDQEFSPGATHTREIINRKPR